MNLRPSAIPLMTSDPFFSIWSMSDKLNEDVTHHWTGKRNPMSAAVCVDDKIYYLMGQMMCDGDRHSTGYYPVIEQTSVEVFPTRTIYCFENSVVRVRLTFTSPLLLNRLDILSRPVSYLEYNIEVIDEKKHNIEFYFDMSTECSVNSYSAKTICRKSDYSVYFGNVDQNVLSKSGDSVTIDWGYIHISEPDAYIINGTTKREGRIENLSFDTPYDTFEVYPYVAVKKKELSGVITIGYDDIQPIEYFGTKLDDYYKKYFSNFEEMFKASVEEYESIKQECIRFDNELMNEAEKVSSKYQKIISLSYRQIIAAHKLVADEDGNDILLSKECHSNGCIGTLDITYPSAPIFLKYKPDFVISMLRPIVKYANSGAWKFDFAPHDVGCYPIANGQVYGLEDGKLRYDMQMPVEECGNMLICVAAAVKYGADRLFADENRDILRKWADYLVDKGYDSENQLCTDDFAGHLAHNCNLSIKAIMGIAAYGKLFNDEKYINIAKEYAKKWSIDAANGVATKLAFDVEDSWSLKYNIVWDKLLGINIFEDEIFEKEIKLYSSKMNKYGVPLDSRADYGKIDWLMWTTVMTDNLEYRDRVIDVIYDYINETPDRVPIGDWYYTSSARQQMFQNRSVLGGIFIPLI